MGSFCLQYVLQRYQQQIVASDRRGLCAGLASTEIALNTTFVAVQARTGSGAQCSNHNSDTENPSVVVYFEQEQQVSLP